MLRSLKATVGLGGLLWGGGLLALLACDPADDGPADDSRAGGLDCAELEVSGSPRWTEGLAIAGFFAASATVAGQPHFLLVDTGAPQTLLDESIARAASISAEEGRVELQIGGLRIRDAQYALADLGGGGLTGILGADNLCQFSVHFDYRKGRFALGFEREPPPSEDLGAERLSMSFKLLGGRYRSSSGPPTRILVWADVEGHPGRYLLDTGSQLTAISPQLFEDLGRDGRAHVAVEFEGAAGTRLAYVERARSVKLGDAEVRKAPVVTAAESSLAYLRTEIGLGVDGFIGGSFLERFMLTIDYPNRELELTRYVDDSHVVDFFKTLGIFPRRAPEEAGRRWAVDFVDPGSEAERQGVRPGMLFVSVDRRETDAMDPVRILATLTGTVGAIKRVELENEGVFHLPVRDRIPLR